MSWNGSGVFTRTYGSTGWVNDANAGILILATRHDTNDDDLSTGINACLTRNNEAKPTANFAPAVDNSYSLGTSSLRWSSAYLGTSLVFQGASFATTVTAAPTANRAIVMPDRAGTLALTRTVLAANISTSGAGPIDLVASGLAGLGYNEIVVEFDGVSLSGTNNVLLQISDDSGFLTSGYNNRCATLADATAVAVNTSTSGFILNAGVAGGGLYGSVILTRQETTATPGGDTWAITGSLHLTSTGGVILPSGNCPLNSATPRKTLDGLRVTVTGANTFDAGSIYVYGRA